jgi:hypothetical protein
MSEKEIREPIAGDADFNGDQDAVYGRGSIAATQKSRWERSWPVIACGSGMTTARACERCLTPCSQSSAGLFSDGFSQSIIGPVNTMLKILYKDEYTKSSAQQNVSSIAFAGTVLGQCTNICDLESAMF